MKTLLALLVLPVAAHAQSFFQFEAGVGVAYTHDMGDGTWYQLGVPHKVQLTTPAFLAGVTGDLYSNGRWDVRYHLDYQYFGTQSASCLCVGDSQYVRNQHKALVPGYIPFNSSGHVQGVSLTLEPGYMWHGTRFSFEAGPWVFWDTWHVHRADPAYPNENDISHRTVPQLGAVAGLRAERGSYSVSYRYYYEPTKGNPYPGIANGTHMLMLTKRF